MADPRTSGDPHAPDESRSLIDTIGLAQCVGVRRAAPEAKTIRRIIFVVVLAWVPALAFSYAEGRAFSGVAIPFLKDFSIALRALVAIPILLLAPALLGRLLRRIVEHLDTCGIIRDEERERYESAKREAQKSRDSRFEKLLVLALVMGLAFLNLLRPTNVNPGSWMVDPNGPAFGRSTAGLWQALVTTPVYLFLVFEWLRRIGIWDRFLFRVSRLNLNLVGSHPDRTGGLGFLSFAQSSFGVVLLALSIGFAGGIGVRVVFEGDTLQSHLPSIITVVLIEILLILIPLTFFGPLLRRARRRAWFEYAHLAGRQSQAFARRWLGGRSPDDEELRSSPDVSTTTDMGGVFDIVADMGPNGLLKRAGFAVAGPALVPFLPLALTEVPLSQILKALIGLVL